MLKHFVLQSTTKPYKVGYESHLFAFLVPDEEEEDIDVLLDAAIRNLSKYEDVDILVEISDGEHDGYRYVMVDYIDDATDEAITDDYYLFIPQVHTYKQRGA